MNPAEDADDIYNMAQKILASVNEVFNEAGVALPEKQFCYAGVSFPHDCEQVALGFAQTYPGINEQANEPQQCNTPRSALFKVEVVRDCTPTLQYLESQTTGRQRGSRMSAPSAETLNNDARMKMSDSSLLLEAAMRCASDWAGVVADVSAGEPSGMYQGMQLNITVVVE